MRVADCLIDAPAQFVRNAAATDLTSCGTRAMVPIMLHMRRDALALVWDSVRGAWDRLSASDPGLLRLTLAVRGTLSVFLTTIAATVVTRLTGLSIVDFASAI